MIQTRSNIFLVTNTARPNGYIIYDSMSGKPPVTTEYGRPESRTQRTNLVARWRDVTVTSSKQSLIPLY